MIIQRFDALVDVLLLPMTSAREKMNGGKARVPVRRRREFLETGLRCSTVTRHASAFGISPRRRIIIIPFAVVLPPLTRIVCPLFKLPGYQKHVVLLLYEKRSPKP